MSNLLNAIRIGFMILTALQNLVSGNAATIEFSHRGIAYRVTLERVSDFLARISSGRGSVGA